MKKIFFILILLNFNFIHVFSVEPDVFVQSTVNRASEILAKNISQEEKINTIYGQMANLNPFTNTKKTEVVVEQIEITTAAPVVEIIQPIEAEEIVTPVIPKRHAYYIIAGAFAEQKNANKLLQKLKRWNYNASIVEGGNLMRVSYNSFSNKEDAVLALAEIRKENNSAWLLTK